jgi:hypothetical protein
MAGKTVLGRIGSAIGSILTITGMSKSKSFLAYGDVVYSNKLCANASANLLHHHAMQLYEELP